MLSWKNLKSQSSEIKMKNRSVAQTFRFYLQKSPFSNCSTGDWKEGWCLKTLPKKNLPLSFPNRHLNLKVLCWETISKRLLHNNKGKMLVNAGEYKKKRRNASKRWPKSTEGPTETPIWTSSQPIIKQNFTKYLSSNSEVIKPILNALICC